MENTSMTSNEQTPMMFRSTEMVAPRPIDWRHELPVLVGDRVLLRELRPSDAPSLCNMLTAPEVQRFMSPPPASSETFERFIVRTRGQQAAGRFACYAVTLHGHEHAIGIFQIRETEARFSTAEWGFALGSPFWGTGIFKESAELVIEFAFNVLGVHRLEARAAVRNGRGNRALQKVGAVPEGILRKALQCGDEYLDQTIYGILKEDWLAARRGYVSPETMLVH